MCKDRRPLRGKDAVEVLRDKFHKAIATRDDGVARVVGFVDFRDGGNV